MPKVLLVDTDQRNAEPMLAGFGLATPFSTMGSGSNISSPAEPICQQIKWLRLPISKSMMTCIADTVDISFDRHSKTNGSTASLIHGDMAGQKFFSVSTYPARTIQPWESPTWEQLFEFAKANLDLLSRPGHALGTWRDDFEGVHVIDVAVLTPHRQIALGLALHFNQRAIYDLEARRVISVPHPSRELEQDRINEQQL